MAATMSSTKKTPNTQMTASNEGAGSSKLSAAAWKAARVRCFRTSGSSRTTTVCPSETTDLGLRTDDDRGRLRRVEPPEQPEKVRGCHAHAPDGRASGVVVDEHGRPGAGDDGIGVVVDDGEVLVRRGLLPKRLALPPERWRNAAGDVLERVVGRRRGVLVPPVTAGKL